MENKKKMIFNVLFLFLVFVATLYGVFHGEDLSEIAEILKTVNLYWLFPGVVCVIIFIWGESIIIFYMMHPHSLQAAPPGRPTAKIQLLSS